MNGRRNPPLTEIKLTCNTCEWFVEETDKIGDYQHKEAKKKGKGFCLIKDFFTNVKSADKSCEDYRVEG